MKIAKILTSAAVLMAALAVTSCTEKKFHVSGNITEAKDSLLYFENMGLNGAVTVDSVRLGADGSFAFDAKAPEHPEFYRLRIDRQIVNIAIDSTENITVKASYPTMSGNYDVQGSEECARIKELAIMQLNLQARINAIVQNPEVSYDREADSVATVLAG